MQNDRPEREVDESNIVCPAAYAALKTGLEAGLRIVREHVAAGGYVLSHSDFPEMKYFDSGLPHFSKSSLFDKRAPLDYTSVFRDEKRPDTIPEWAAFAALGKSNEQLKTYFDTTSMYRHDAEGLEQLRAETEHHFILHTISRMVDLYIHHTRSQEFDESKFYPLYKEWENAVFSERVVFDIVCPLLMVKFDFDSLDIGGDQLIERMPDEFQLARSIDGFGFVSTNEVVAGAATHALVLRHWSVKNGPRYEREGTLGNIEVFRDVIHRIDYFFSALRAVSGVATGYSQLIVRPDGWADRRKAHLPQINIVRLRAYPDHFEHYGWLQTPPVVSREAGKEAGELYGELLRLNKNQLALAARRLNMALLRNSEQDSILDVTIGLETLLVPDSGRGEITHKLAMRLAAVGKLWQFESYTPQEIFDLCKKLYDYRSAVAHGAGDLEKKRAISIKAVKEPIPVIGIGTALLRHAIRFLTKHPEYLDSKRLDMRLLSADASV